MTFCDRRRVSLIETLESRQHMDATPSEALAVSMLRAMTVRPTINMPITGNTSPNNVALASRVTSARSVSLTPGTGFTTPVDDNLPPVGIGQGADEKVIARWDVVPYQTLNKTMGIGVVAFHMNGINRVEFSVDGGTPVVVKRMTMNPETKVVEYWTTLDANKFSTDGAVEVRAIIYPRVGVPRALEGLPLNVNKGGTLPSREVYVAATGSDTEGDGTAANPFQTINRAARAGALALNGSGDGLTVRLGAGDYSWPSLWNDISTRNAWLTLTTSPGVAREQVRIVSPTGSGLSTSLIKLSNITIGDGTTPMVLYNAGWAQNPFIWMDNVDWVGAGRSINMNGQTVVGFSGSYWTNSTMHDSSSNISGILVRNCSVTKGVIAYQNIGMIINSSTSDLTIPEGTNFHPDALQFYQTTAGWGNVIIYGFTAVPGPDAPMIAQGITLGPAGFKDVAIVNARVNATMTSFAAQAAQGSGRHLYISNCQFLGYVSGWLDAAGHPLWSVQSTGFEAINVVLEETPTQNSNLALSLPGVIFR